MFFSKRKIGMLVCLALMVMSPAALAAEDFTVQIPVSKTANRPAAQTDFYLYVNHDWLQKTAIPPEESVYDDCVVIGKKVRDELSGITTEAVKKQAAKTASSDESRIAGLYACITDQKGRNAAGLGNLAKPLQAIEASGSLQEYADTMAGIAKTYGMDATLGGFSVGNNPIDNDRYVVFLSEPDTGLSREFLENSHNEKYFGYYQDYMRELLVLYGRTPESAARSAEELFALKKDLALHSMSLAEAYDPSKSTHRLHISDVKKLYSHIDAEAMLQAAGVGPVDGVHTWYVSDPGVIARFNELYTPDRLSLWKDYALVTILADHAKFLTQDYQRLAYAFSQKMQDVKVQKSEKRKNEELNQSILQQYYGRIYAKQYFSAQQKKEVENYLKLIQVQYKKMLNQQTWMSPATRQEAIKKLDGMAVHIGYPEAWPEYLDRYTVTAPKDGGVLINNVMNLTSLVTVDMRQKFGQPVRKDLWEAMMPQTVNAFYDPQNNSINFPAAILQKPFYDPKADQATNLGGIGSVIAHEITHSFDSGGAQYDEQGRLHDWWTENDYAAFKKRQANIVTFYNRYVLPDGTRCDGKQTLTENIADLGALSCLSNIIGDHPEALRRMYTQYAICWRTKLTEGALARYLADVHSLPYIRTDAVLSSDEGFYKAYNVKPGDGMYVAPEERAKLW